MTKYRVSELEGALLDAAVAEALGFNWEMGDDGTLQKRPRVYVEHRYASGMPYDQEFRPTDWWSDGGPIIERESIELMPVTKGLWAASALGTDFNEAGPTPLIAAIRSYVASKFGEYVDLP